MFRSSMFPLWERWLTDWREDDWPNSFVGAVYLPPYLWFELMKTWFPCLFSGEMLFLISFYPVFDLFIDFLVIDLLLQELPKFFPFNFDELTKDTFSYEVTFLSEWSLCNMVSWSNLITEKFGFNSDPCSTNNEELFDLRFYFLWTFFCVASIFSRSFKTYSNLSQLFNWLIIPFHESTFWRKLRIFDIVSFSYLNFCSAVLTCTFSKVLKLFIA